MSHHWNRANSIFDAIDTDKSGEIDSGELMEHCLRLGQEQDTVVDLLKQLDTNKDGLISREEFVCGFKKYQAFCKLGAAPSLLVATGQREKMVSLNKVLNMSLAWPYEKKTDWEAEEDYVNAAAAALAQTAVAVHSWRFQSRYGCKPSTQPLCQRTKGDPASVPFGVDLHFLEALLDVLHANGVSKDGLTTADVASIITYATATKQLDFIAPR